MACERARVGTRRAQTLSLGLPHAWLCACSNCNEPATLVYRHWGSRRCVSGWRRRRRRERYAHTRGPVYVLELAAERLMAMASVDSSRMVSLHGRRIRSETCTVRVRYTTQERYACVRVQVVLSKTHAAATSVYGGKSRTLQRPPSTVCDSRLGVSVNRQT